MYLNRIDFEVFYIMFKNTLLLILGFTLGIYHKGSDISDIFTQKEHGPKETFLISKKQQRILKDEKFQEAMATMLARDQLQRMPANKVDDIDEIEEKKDSEIELPIEEFEIRLKNMTTDEKKSLLVSLEDEIRWEEEYLAEIQARGASETEDPDILSNVRDSLDQKKQKLELLINWLK